jgi:hypothetical protein
MLDLMFMQVRTLLGEPAPTIIPREIRPGAGQTLHAIMRHHASHWSCLLLISHVIKLQSQHDARMLALVTLTNSSKYDFDAAAVNGKHSSSALFIALCMRIFSALALNECLVFPQFLNQS